MTSLPTVGQSSKQIQQQSNKNVSHPEAHFASVQTKTMVNRVTHAKTSLQSDNWTFCLCCYLHFSPTVNQGSNHLFTYSTCRSEVYGCVLLDVSIFCHYSNSKVSLGKLYFWCNIPDFFTTLFSCIFTIVKLQNRWWMYLR